MGRIWSQEEREKEYRRNPEWGWRKRRNRDRRIVDETNTEIYRQIEEIKDQLRAMRSRPDGTKREMYSAITHLELRRLDR